MATVATDKCRKDTRHCSISAVSQEKKALEASQRRNLLLQPHLHSNTGKEDHRDFLLPGGAQGPQGGNGGLQHGNEACRGQRLLPEGHRRLAGRSQDGREVGQQQERPNLLLPQQERVVGQEVPWLPLGEVGAGAGGSHGETEQREHWHWGGPRITDLSRVSEQLLSLLKIKEQGKVRAEGQGKVWA